MQKVEVILLSGNTVLGALDIGNSEDFPIAISYSVGSIEDISKRRGSSSKKFTIPATKNNNELFNQKYITGQDDTRAFKVDCVLQVDGIPIDRGVLRVEDISQDYNPKDYECVFISNNTEWFEALKTKNIRDYSYDNQAATNSNIGSQFSGNVVTSASTAGLVTYDYDAQMNSWQENQATFDYVYPFAGYGSLDNRATGGQAFVSVNDFVPNVYVKNIVDKMFDDIGWNVQSSFFDSADFKKLVVNCKTIDHVRKSFRIDQPFDVTDNYGIQDVIFNSVAFAGAPTVVYPVDGEDTISTETTILNGPITALLEGAAPTIVKEGAIGLAAAGLPNPIDTSSYPTQGWVIREETDVNVTASFTVTNNSSNSAALLTGSKATLWILVQDPAPFPTTSPVETYSAVSSSEVITGLSTRTVTTTFEGTVKANTRIIAVLVLGRNLVSGQSGSIIDQNLTVSNGSIVLNVDTAQPVNENETYYIGPNLADIKSFDFIKGLAQVFNLYFWADNGTKTVYCEPRESFYDAFSQSEDWTSKIDVNATIKIPYNYKQELKFIYKEDSSDGYVKARNEELTVPIGGAFYELPDFFTKGSQDIKNDVFAFTPSYVDDQMGDFIRIGRMWSEDEYYPEWDVNKGIRLMYFTFEPQYNNNATTENVWNYVDGSNKIDKVPSAVCDNSAFPLYYATSDGLLNTYFADLLRTIEKNIVLEVNVYLTPTDMKRLDLRTPVYIGQGNYKGYYYIDEITDFKPTRTQLTKVRLIPLVKYSVATTVGDVPSVSDEGRYSIGRQGRSGGLVAKNGFDNYATGRSVAIGNDVQAFAPDQHFFGNVTVANTTDIYQFGAGATGEPYKGVTFDKDGQFYPHGGDIFLTTGVQMVTAVQFDGDEPTAYTKVYLDGNG